MPSLKPSLAVLETRERHPRWSQVVLFALVLVAFLLDLLSVQGEWTQVRGYEYEWVAGSLATGTGFSFDGTSRWLFDVTTVDDFYATAWVEPVYPFLYAGFFRLFGAEGKLAMLIAQSLFFSLTLVVVYLLGVRLAGSVGGLAAATLLALLPHSHNIVTRDLSNATLAALLVAASALTTLWCLDKISVWRCLTLGVVIGVTSLTHGGMILLAPAGALLVLVSKDRVGRRAWRGTAVTLVGAVLIVFPWSLRNYLTFSEPVLVRTGLGHNLYMGSCALVPTYRPDLLPLGAPVEPPWSAAGPADAWVRVNEPKRRYELRQFAKTNVEGLAPADYPSFNEAQRDSEYSRQAVAFVKDNPLTVTRLVLLKAGTFLYSFRYRGLPLAGLLTLLAIFGVLAGARDPAARVVLLLLIVASAQYLVTAQLFYRYRFPSEPLIVTLAGLAIVRIARRWESRWTHEPR